ncbi:protein TolQ [Marinimicrobium alkaliphilum]|uniref:protein TolQ n=1 Tax=Marinimicrobium alkaliphilum TaxID=2202654 RepID=UPI000DB95EBB|nr:protein TolQ [Marinimicrobium alkaliphilum]
MSDVQHSMSIWGLIADAGVLVQLVMLSLLLASVFSWVVIVQRGIYQTRARSQFLAFEKQFWSGVDLGNLYRQGNGRVIDGAETIFRAGFKEFTRLRQQSGADSDAVMDGSQRAMRVALAREEEKLESGLPFLASVGSVSPYVGLFGTVWGIMNAFRGLASVHQPTLAVVAPGIAEALIATAMGLFAAIPAVLAFNRYSSRAESLLGNYQTFAEEFSSILHRQVHHKNVSS